jgi:hypothetical protein
MFLTLDARGLRKRPEQNLVSVGREGRGVPLLAEPFWVNGTVLITWSAVLGVDMKTSCEGVCLGSGQISFDLLVQG